MLGRIIGKGGGDGGEGVEAGGGVEGGAGVGELCCYKKGKKSEEENSGGILFRVSLGKPLSGDFVLERIGEMAKELVCRDERKRFSYRGIEKSWDIRPLDLCVTIMESKRLLDRGQYRDIRLTYRVPDYRW